MPKIPWKDWPTDPDVLLAAYRESCTLDIPEASLTYPYPLLSFTRTPSGITMIVNVNGTHVLITLDPAENGTWRADYWMQVFTGSSWDDSPLLPLAVQQANDPPCLSITIARNISSAPARVITYERRSGHPINVSTPTLMAAKNVIHETIVHAAFMSRQADLAHLLSTVDGLTINQRNLLASLGDMSTFTLEGIWNTVPFKLTHESLWENEVSFSFYPLPDSSRERGGGTIRSARGRIYRDMFDLTHSLQGKPTCFPYRETEKMLGLPSEAFRRNVTALHHSCGLAGEHLTFLFLVLANDALHATTPDGNDRYSDTFRRTFNVKPPYDTLMTGRPLPASTALAQRGR